MNEPARKVNPMDAAPRRLVTTLGITAACGLLAAALLGGLDLGRAAPAATAAATTANATQQGGSSATQLASDNSASTTSAATITVTAAGQVSGAPDTVAIQMGITANGASASAALDQANTEMNTLESVFLAYTSKSQLQTSNLDLQPNYDSSGSISGYSADEELTVTMNRIDLAGRLIDSASHAVGNFGHIDGITFSISHTSGLMAAARAQAMQNAHLEASQIAAGAGVSLGPIKSVTDQEQPPQQQNFYPAASNSLGAAVPLQGGRQSLSVQVQVVYALGK
jgi:uncharacterized protein YggE